MKKPHVIARYLKMPDGEEILHLADGRQLRSKGDPGAAALIKTILTTAAEKGIHIKPGDRFKIRPKGGFPVDDSGKDAIEVEFSRIHDMPPETVDAGPLEEDWGKLQSLKDWSEYIWRIAKNDQMREVALAALEAQVFEFGEVDELELLKENARAIELRDKGFLRLPYRCCMFRYTGNISGRTIVIAVQEGPALQFERQHSKEIVAIKDHLVYPLCLLLSAKGTQTRLEVPSPKLQAKRQARNKAPLPVITHVDAKHWQAAARRTDQGGTHASPIPHLRRGHLRHYSNGHVVWIRDCFVNCKSLEEAFPRARYEVQHE